MARVFSIAGVLLTLSRAALWYRRSLLCPADPIAARPCQRLIRVSAVLYGLAFVSFCVVTIFALLLPLFNG